METMYKNLNNAFVTQMGSYPHYVNKLHKIAIDYMYGAGNVNVGQLDKVLVYIRSHFTDV